MAMLVNLKAAISKAVKQMRDDDLRTMHMVGGFSTHCTLKLGLAGFSGEDFGTK